MAATYIPIASTTLSSSAASVTFSSIPQTYTDLVLRMSMRTGTTGFTLWTFAINGTTTNYSSTGLYGTGSTTESPRRTSGTDQFFRMQGTSTSTDTANTFANQEIYIPNYTANANKPISVSVARENNATDATVGVFANLWGNTSAITSITISAFSTDNLLSGSTFHLYGIKNS